MPRTSAPFHVVIAGASIAGLEAALALRELAGERLEITLVEPDADFVVRPMRVVEPFAHGAADRYPLAEIAEDIGASLCVGRCAWVDPPRREVHLDGGRVLGYDALLIAVGAAKHASLPHAVALDDATMDEQLHGLVQDIEDGYVHQLAITIPSPMPWPLPAYELALMAARRASDMCVEVSVTVTTPEEAPLAILGEAASREVGALLAANGVEVIPGATAASREHGVLHVSPGDRLLRADRVVALPRLSGPALAGIPRSARGGFISVDGHGKVAGLDRVYAAGDATAYPIKHGGLASQQADVASEAIAALAGAPVEPHLYNPVLSAKLIGGERPLYLRARLIGAHGAHAEVSGEPLWSPPRKVAARYLGPYLETRSTARIG